MLDGFLSQCQVSSAVLRSVTSDLLDLSRHHTKENIFVAKSHESHKSSDEVHLLLRMSTAKEINSKQINQFGLVACLRVKKKVFSKNSGPGECESVTVKL